ncbi:hypothetical protein EAH72_07670 [Pseudomonas caspiana]|uniref:DUF4760 domain-containing protein n=1 Tax=Pseudomonas mandelii TaxID=75612 RepID=A0A502IMM4_9PSED|nr:hypothetical protein EAH74_02130 [Pseudomonas mandelii]TPG97650.1 hypothetical protein EAH72_07670 [Pseudomonas caspiana]
MELLKSHWIRFVYCFISTVIVWAALLKQEIVVGSPTTLNNFSYVGTVITIVALIISISEVLHSVRYSRSISAEAKKVLKEAKAVEGASAVSECLATLNETAGYMDTENYQLALKCYQHFRILFAKIPGTGQEFERIDNILGETETAVRKGIFTSASAPLEKTTRILIHHNLENIKENLEKVNPARGRQYVTA